MNWLANFVSASSQHFGSTCPYDGVGLLVFLLAGDLSASDGIMMPTSSIGSDLMNPVVKVVQPSGILDGTKTDLLCHEINRSIGEGADVILIDLEKVSFIDSSGLGALVVALKTARAAEKRLCLCSINEQVEMLFSLTQMNQVFEIFGDRQAFELTLGG